MLLIFSCSADVDEGHSPGKGAGVNGMELLINGAPAEVSINSEGLRWVPSNDTSADITGDSTQSLFSCLSFLQSLATGAENLLFSEMVAAQRAEESPITPFGWTQGPKLFGVAIYTLRRSPGKASEWHPWRFTLESPNEELIQQLHSELTTGIAAASKTRPRRLLVILNPNAGSGAARTHYRSVVHPIFARAGIATRIMETTHAGHAALRFLKSPLLALLFLLSFVLLIHPKNISPHPILPS